MIACEARFGGNFCHFMRVILHSKDSLKGRPKRNDESKNESEDGSELTQKAPQAAQAAVSILLSNTSTSSFNVD